jgi:predicted small secreted protein
MKKTLAFFFFVILLAALTTGCDEKSGILPDIPVEPDYTAPTISNVQIQNSNISKCGGGIMRISCDWSSPAKVSTATAYLGFVKTITDPDTEPVAVIGSQPVEIDDFARQSLLLQQIASITCVASDTALFYSRYSRPIAIPTKIGTNEKSGRWEVDIPFAPEDTFMAPLGVYQMILYMKINRIKTNTLSFEMTFVP